MNKFVIILILILSFVYSNAQLHKSVNIQGVIYELKIDSLSCNVSISISNTTQKTVLFSKSTSNVYSYGNRLIINIGVRLFSLNGIPSDFLLELEKLESNHKLSFDLQPSNKISRKEETTVFNFDFIFDDSLKKKSKKINKNGKITSITDNYLEKCIWIAL